MWKELVHSKNEKRHVHANDLKVGAPGNLAKTLYESKKIVKIHRNSEHTSHSNQYTGKGVRFFFYI